VSATWSPRRVGVPLFAALVALATLAVALFPRAFPFIALKQNLTPAIARAVADSFATAHALPWHGSRTAVRFEGDDDVQTYLDLEGGADTVRAVVGGRDYALFTWGVRRFTPGDAHETRLTLSPDGRVLGFERRLADSTRRPNLPADSAQRLAEVVRSEWLREGSAEWRLASQSYDTKAGSARVDRTFTFERADRQLIAAPLRLVITIGGDLPTAARRRAAVPEAFERRYREMRSANDQLANFAGVGALLLMIGALLVLRHYSGTGQIRWRESWIAGGVVGGLALAAGLNLLPLAWFDYDTATSAGIAQASMVAAAVFAGLLTTLQLALTLAAAEVASRHAFPRQVSWWRWWGARGTRQVAGRVMTGYAVAAFGLAYVAFFYLMTRRVFGWWVPTELVDNPNLMATRAPWLAGVAMSLEAGVWEEALFRVLPLSLLSLWVGNRAGRGRWMALGVVATALVFGFAHANYPSWPAYSRGVEIFFDACLWGALVVWLGPLATMLGHFLYDLILFGLFAAAGTAPAYRVSAAIIVLVALAPAMAVGWQWWRQRGLVEVSDSDLAGGMRAPGPPPPLEQASAMRLTTLSPLARRLAVLLGVSGLVLSFAAPHRPTLGADATATRGRALVVADSVLAARGISAPGWTRLTGTAAPSIDEWRRFLVEHRAEPMAAALATTYQPPAWWIVRYVRPHGRVEERAEEWRVRVFPDGRVLDVRHVLPDAAWRDSVSVDSARILAQSALRGAGIDAARLAESRQTSDHRAGAKGARQRVDIAFTYTDTTVHLPGDALARVRVELAGNEVVLVRRSVELPETFRRADTKRQTTRLMVAGTAGLTFVLFVVVGILWTRNLRAAQRHDRLFNRRRAIVAIAVLATVTLVGAVNGLPSTLAGYDTAQPWGRFLAGEALQTMMLLLGVFLLAVLWSVFDGMRRRVGIPLFAEGGDSWRLTAIAGLGLAGAQATLAGTLAWLAGPRVANAPSLDALDTLLPQLDGALDLIRSFFVGALLLGIVAFVIMLVARSTARRLALTLLLGALAAVLIGTVAMGRTATPHPALLAVLLALALPLAYVALRTWAATSVAAWMVASLLVTAMQELAALRSAATTTAQGAALATLGASVILLALVRRLVTHWGAAPERQSNPPTGDEASDA